MFHFIVAVYPPCTTLAFARYLVLTLPLVMHFIKDMSLTLSNFFSSNALITNTKINLINYLLNTVAIIIVMNVLTNIFIILTDDYFNMTNGGLLRQFPGRALWYFVFAFFVIGC